MSRECPVCRVPLKLITVKDRLQIDFCLRCRGIWFDKDELSRTQTQGELPEQFRGSFDLNRDKVVCQSCGTSNLRSRSTCEQCHAPLEFLCPVCRIQLEDVPIGSVYIDRCHKCHGVWLDGGELTLLFEEFKHRKQQELQRVRHDGGNVAGNLAVWATIDALDLLIWRPDIAYRAGETVTDVISGLPGTVAGGVGTVIEGVGNIPEVAGDLAEGTVELASGAAEFAGDMVGGAIELAGDIPEIAGNVAEVAGSFIEVLFEIIASLFDN